jgi:hypothetical protein
MNRLILFRGVNALNRSKTVYSGSSISFPLHSLETIKIKDRTIEFSFAHGHVDAEFTNAFTASNAFTSVNNKIGDDYDNVVFENLSITDCKIYNVEHRISWY